MAARMLRFCLVVLLVVPAGLSAGEPDSRAAVASAHPLATQAGREIMEAGGNAFDAAVAVTAALAVVEPYSSGIGGGGFWMLHEADTGRNVMVDGRETAPQAAGPDMYLDDDGEVMVDRAREGALAAGIPGEPAALAHIAEEYGRLPLARSLAPAIRLARDGFEVDPLLAERTRRREDLLDRHPASRKLFLPEGRSLREGERLRQPALAETLEALAREGRAGFYEGEVARKLVQAVRDAGGIWSMEDLAGYEVVEREPVTGEYRGHRIVSARPPSSGGVVLVEALNILSGYDLAGRSRAERIHLLVEAMRRAYRDRNEFLGDPAFVDNPVDRLTDPRYAAGLRASIRTDRAMPSRLLAPVDQQSEGEHTSHFSVLDPEGNRVSATVTVNYWFGAGMVAEGTGVVLNNEMYDFSLKPGHPDAFDLVESAANAIAPGKRMLSSMTPTFVENEEGTAILGTPGGSRIISMVLLGLLEYVDGGDAEAIVSRPRLHHQYLPDEIQFEPDALTGGEREALEAMGHRLEQRDERYGNMQAITRNSVTGEVTAASDPRGIGAGIVFGIGEDEEGER